MTWDQLYDVSKMNKIAEKQGQLVKNRHITNWPREALTAFKPLVVPVAKPSPPHGARAAGRQERE